LWRLGQQPWLPSLAIPVSVVEVGSKKPTWKQNSLQLARAFLEKKFPNP